MWRRGSISFLTNFLFVLAFLAFAGLGAVARENTGWDFGTPASARFLTNSQMAAKPLTMVGSGRAGLMTPRFVLRVGGVSFEAVAKPDQQVTDKPIELSYAPARPDGSRMVVRIGQTTLTADLPDWELQPVAKFAATDYSGVVSLFGDGPDRKKYYYIQYHDAFKDTLLGMRLLQADILFMSLGEHWRVPRYNGQPVFGRGEQQAQEAQAMDAARTLQAAMVGQKYRSWVLTDTDTNPTFGIDHAKLALRGHPFYFFWAFDEKELKEKNEQQQKLIAEFDQLRTRVQAAIQQYNGIADRIDDLVKQHNQLLDEGRKKTAKAEIDLIERQLDRLKAEIDMLKERRKPLKDEIETGKARIAELDKQIEAAVPQVHEVSALTTRMRQLEPTLAKYNRSVYQAYEQTALFAAFFRYVKKTNPQNWQAFYHKVKDIAIQPTVTTPTAWEKRAEAQR